MKKIISVVLTCALLLSACGSPSQTTNVSSVANVDNRTMNIDNSASDSAGESNAQLSDVSTQSENIENIRPNTDPTQLDITVKGLDDEALLSYVEDSIYLDLISELDSEDYVVEGVEAIYYPKEYIEALASNSQANVYFGYTAAELDAQFQGTKYVFTLGEDGQTIVVPMETINDDVYVKALEDVIIGSGAILICVTVSIVAAPAAPAVSMIFAASATTGTTFALESGAISFAAAAIAKGYETESLSEALKAGVEASGEGFKWGAITGIAFGGGKEAFALKKATRSGLSMNDVARIQKDSGFPLDLISEIKSMEEYQIYKDAGLYTKMVDGKLALVRDIPLDYVSELPNGEKVTNLVRMQKGYAPIDPATGKAFQLHHVNQNANGTLAILTEAEHQGNSSILNTFGKESEIDREAFSAIRKEFWQKFAAGLS